MYSAFPSLAPRDLFFFLGQIFVRLQLFVRSQFQWHPHTGRGPHVLILGLSGFHLTLRCEIGDLCLRESLSRLTQQPGALANFYGGRDLTLSGSRLSDVAQSPDVYPPLEFLWPAFQISSPRGCLFDRPHRPVRGFFSSCETLSVPCRSGTFFLSIENSRKA